MFHQTCDGVRRRDFLKAGVLGGLGLTLADALRLEAAGATSAAPAKSAILVFLEGGPSHMDTFDLKPAAGAEYRGEFNPIDTNVPGVQISEHLPKLAQHADKFAIVRGVSHSLAAHALGQKYLSTGNRPIPSIEFPGYGSVVAKEKGGEIDLPGYVAIPKTTETTGYLGVQYAALQTNAVPKAGQPFQVRGVALAGNTSADEAQRRSQLLTDLDGGFGEFAKQSPLLSGLDKFSEQAQSIITSSRTRNAFDVGQESPGVSELFSDSGFAQSCLLATRLVEAGVRFVTVSFGGWDTHQDNWNRLKNRNLPELDAGLSGLFAALALKGLLSSTAVMVTGEFGRTPKINNKTGRDHWPRAMFTLLAGGGIKAGQAFGASDENGMGPADKGIAPDDVAATFYANLGIDPTKEYHTNVGRPVMIVRNGQPIPGLLS